MMVRSILLKQCLSKEMQIFVRAGGGGSSINQLIGLRGNKACA